MEAAQQDSLVNIH